MNKIKLLDKTLVDKIAAGEVVERPASVVKELLENSIDAASSFIEVEIRGGGIEYIRVTDDGVGIDKKDLKLAFARHATSKLESEADLWSINSMGFRGEALSSIAAVARVDMNSNTGSEGYHIKIAGGNVLSFQAAPSPPGSSVTVQDLFFNIPARRKFLKSSVTEGNRIYDIVVRIALSHPEISFCFRNEHRQIFMTSGNGDLREVAWAIFGKDFSRRLLEINLEYGDITVTGLISKPDLTRKNRKGQIFFVNRRVVKNQILSVSLEKAYSGFLLSMERPVGIVFLTIPADQVDVNVHPQKTEVRFRDEKTVFKVIQTAVREELLKRTMPEMTTEPFRFPVEGVSEYDKVPNLSPVMMREDPLEFSINTDDNSERPRVFGQWKNSYLICEINGLLIIVDQHAAHERLLYNQIREHSGQKLEQELAVPVGIELSPDFLSLVESKQNMLNNLGYKLDRFGEKTMVIRSIPAVVAGREVEVLMEILESWESAPPNDEMILDNGLKILACRGSVKAGQKLDQMEMLRLISDWAVTDNRNFCPHGRPTCFTMDKSEMDRFMKR